MIRIPVDALSVDKNGAAPPTAPAAPTPPAAAPATEDPATEATLAEIPATSPMMPAAKLIPTTLATVAEAVVAAAVAASTTFGFEKTVANSDFSLHTASLVDVQAIFTPFAHVDAAAHVLHGSSAVDMLTNSANRHSPGAHVVLATAGFS